MQDQARGVGHTHGDKIRRALHQVGEEGDVACLAIQFGYVNNQPLISTDITGYDPGNGNLKTPQASLCPFCDPAALLGSGGGDALLGFTTTGTTLSFGSGNAGDGNAPAYGQIGVGTYTATVYEIASNGELVPIDEPMGNITFGNPNDTNGGWFQGTSTLVGGVGVFSDAAKYGAGAATLGINLNNIFKSKFYLNGWRGNQSVWAGRIATGGEMLGRLSLGASVALDAYGYGTGQISGQKLSVDLAVDAIGAFGGLPGAAFAGAYYGPETFYPGGAAGALNEYGNITQQNQAIDPNYQPMDPGKISFHPKHARDEIPDYKKSKKRNDVINPENVSTDPGKT